MGKVADLVNKLNPHKMTFEELHELAALLDSLMSQAGRFTAWSMPGDGQVREGPGIDITGSNRVGVGLDSILLADSSADTAAREYAASSAGLDLALAAATSGDVLLLPARSITGNHTITAGVNVVGYSRYATKLTGQITHGVGSTVENLTMVRTADDASTYKALINQASGTSYAHSCDIKVEQSGSGAAYAISLDGAGSMELWNCLVYASSAGTAYAWYDGGGGGDIYQFGGRAYGSTAIEG